MLSYNFKPIKNIHETNFYSFFFFNFYKLRLNIIDQQIIIIMTIIKDKRIVKYLIHEHYMNEYT